MLCPEAASSTVDFSVKSSIAYKMASVAFAAARIWADFNCAKCLKYSKSFNDQIVITDICCVVSMF